MLFFSRYNRDKLFPLATNILIILVRVSFACNPVIEYRIETPHAYFFDVLSSF